MPELVQFIHAMSQDEQVDLVALAWLGRDDGDIEDWQALRAEGRAPTTIEPRRIFSGCRYCPISSRNGLSKLGGSCMEFTSERP